MGEWKCPKCGAPAHDHGPGRKDRCAYNPGGRDCEGLLCECEDAGAEESHGTTNDNPCPEANCYCCGWGGKMPAKTRKSEIAALRAEVERLRGLLADVVEAYIEENGGDMPTNDSHPIHAARAALEVKP